MRIWPNYDTHNRGHILHCRCSRKIIVLQRYANFFLHVTQNDSYLLNGIKNYQQYVKISMIVSSQINRFYDNMRKTSWKIIVLRINRNSTHLSLQSFIEAEFPMSTKPMVTIQWILNDPNYKSISQLIIAKCERIGQVVVRYVVSPAGITPTDCWGTHHGGVTIDVERSDEWKWLKRFWKFAPNRNGRCCWARGVSCGRQCVDGSFFMNYSEGDDSTCFRRIDVSTTR